MRATAERIGALSEIVTDADIVGAFAYYISKGHTTVRPVVKRCLLRMVARTCGA